MVNVASDSAGVCDNILIMRRATRVCLGTWISRYAVFVACNCRVVRLPELESIWAQTLISLIKVADLSLEV